MLARLIDWMRGEAITIPPMDGPLRPNTALDQAQQIFAIEAPDNLVAIGDRLIFSSSSSLLSIDLSRPGEVETVAEFGAAITALAAAPGGGFAVGLDDHSVVLHGRTRENEPIAGATEGLCPTALAFLDPDTLILCQGATGVRPSEWARDLMQQGASGALWRIDLCSGKRTRLARQLAFPFGVLVRPEQRSLVVAESWRHRLVQVPVDGGPPEPALVNLPGYPARLSPAADGGAWLCIFAPSNRLIEFVLQENEYREDMLRTIEPELWIAPSLHPRRSFLEPLQCGSVRTMGIHKPWAPSRSYGLLVKLDRDLRPIASFHSRSDGRRHGVTSVVEAAGRVLVGSKGGDAILQLGAPGEGGVAQ
jgi:hypothetical protein